MTRAQALTIAREHVEKMAANSTSFMHKVGAVDAFARFLVEGIEPDEIAIQPRHELTAQRRDLLVQLAYNQLETGPGEYDAATRDFLRELGAL